MHDATRLSDADRRRLEALVRRHEALVRGLAARLAPVPREADDIAQETFLVLLRRHARWDLDEDAGPLLAGIVRNLCRQAWDRALRDRRFRRDGLAEYVAAMAVGPDEQELGGESRKAALRACLDGLGEKEATLLNLRYTASCGSEEIARRFASSADAVRMALSRLRQRLRVCVERRLRGGPA